MCRLSSREAHIPRRKCRAPVAASSAASTPPTHLRTKRNIWTVCVNRFRNVFRNSSTDFQQIFQNSSLYDDLGLISKKQIIMTKSLKFYVNRIKDHGPLLSVDYTRCSSGSSARSSGLPTVSASSRAVGQPRRPQIVARRGYFILVFFKNTFF